MLLMSQVWVLGLGIFRLNLMGDYQLVKRLYLFACKSLGLFLVVFLVDFGYIALYGFVVDDIVFCSDKNGFFFYVFIIGVIDFFFG